MAGSRIKGITVEIGGDTTKLQTALKSVNTEIKNTQTALRDVNKLLKLDPGNTELLAQKHKLLANAIRSVLHFSVPDEGPLTDYEDWMPDFMAGLADGIEKGRSLVQKAVDDAASDMVIQPKVGSMTGDYAGESGDAGLSGENAAGLVSGISTAVADALKDFSGQTGDIVIPVYVGGTLFDEAVVSAQARMNLKSGGR